MMIERRPVLTFVSHLILLIGVLVVAFPVYITFVGSTQSAEQVATSNPLSLVPGNHFFETYKLLKSDDPRSHTVVIQGIHGKAKAVEAIMHSMELYDEKYRKDSDD